MSRAWGVLSAAMVGALLLGSARDGFANPLEVGFGAEDITPKIEDGRPVYIAGYGQDRKATGIHDPLFARAVVLRSQDRKIALVSVDLVGLQYPAVERIRQKLDGFEFVLVSSTHTHEGPDVVGIWGPSPLKSGIDLEYLASVEDRVAAAVRKADSAAVGAKAAYGTATDESLLRDSREPYVYDGVLRVLRFTRVDRDEPIGILVQWNNHPEAMGSKNTLLTADFPWATVAALEKRYHCPVAYFTGVVGGLMTTLRTIKDPLSGKELHEESWEYTEVYGQMVAKLAEQAIASAESIKLTPFTVSVQKIALPLANPGFHLMWFMNVLPRDAYEWLGDPTKIGPVIDKKAGKKNVRGALASEVTYLRLGELDIAGIPGEIYPELVYGKVQEPVDPAADFPDAPVEPSIVGTLPSKKFLIFGLANDEVGYIIPKRQWDRKPPYAYGRTKDQYGEENSVGPDTAPYIMNALQAAVRSAAPKNPDK